MPQALELERVLLPLLVARLRPVQRQVPELALELVLLPLLAARRRVELPRPRQVRRAGSLPQVLFQQQVLRVQVPRPGQVSVRLRRRSWQLPRLGLPVLWLRLRRNYQALLQ